MSIHRQLAALGFCTGLTLSASAQLVFDDVAAAAGVDWLGTGRGVSWSDFDHDGLLDLFVLNDDEPNVAFRQQPDHTFENATAAWGIAPTDKNHWSSVACDFDDDGDDDVFVGCGGFYAAEANLLYRNDIGTLESFSNVSATAGAATGIISSVFGSSALDHDLDGDVDLFFSDTAMGMGTGFGLCHLARNDGGLVFTDVSVPSGISQPGDYRHCSAGDFDSDGLPDVGVGSFTGTNRLYLNDGDGTFTNEAEAVGGGFESATLAFGLVLEDFDLDGWQDIYLPRYQSVFSGSSGLFHNDGEGGVHNQSESSGIGVHKDMGHNSFDLDNDGLFEIWIGTGSPATPALDFLYRITPTGPGGSLIATDISTSSGITAVGLTRGHGSAAADYDGDGDVDLYCNFGGTNTGFSEQERNALFRNQGNANGWMEVELVGVLSNRSAIGASLAAQRSDGTVVRLYRSAGKGFGNTDSPIQHFGLGPVASVERLDIRWPSGLVQTLLAPASGTRHQVVETGLRLLGEPAIGTVATLQLCGPASHVADVLLATAAGEVPKAKFGGYLQVLPPFIGPLSLPLDASGRLDLPFLVPDDPLIVGVTIFLQSWTHPSGVASGPTLTNLLPVTFE